MRVVIATEHRFGRGPDGVIGSMTGGREYKFWQRYLEVFDEVLVLARVRMVNTAMPETAQADGPKVRFLELPDYVGPAGYLQTLPRVRRALQQVLMMPASFILRVPGAIGGVLYRELRRNQHPYALEVVGDPYDVFGPDAVQSLIRPLLRWWTPLQLRRECRHAMAVAYVTAHALQRRYPVRGSAFTTSYSTVELPREAFVKHPRPGTARNRPVTVITVGSLAQRYKALDVLIAATARCVKDGLDLRLVVVGEGKHRSELEAQAAALGLGGRIRFLGQIPSGPPVRAQLDQADLFILPSRTEGLPRAMIEAMARALPCIGSAVGGIPELLSPQCLVPPGDVGALSAKIREVVTEPERMAAMSAQNLEKAGEYCDDVLQPRRVAFYQHVRERTEQWLRDPSQYG